MKQQAYLEQDHAGSLPLLHCLIKNCEFNWTPDKTSANFLPINLQTHCCPNLKELEAKLRGTTSGCAPSSAAPLLRFRKTPHGRFRREKVASPSRVKDPGEKAEPRLAEGFFRAATMSTRLNEGSL